MLEKEKEKEDQEKLIDIEKEEEKIKGSEEEKKEPGEQKEPAFDFTASKDLIEYLFNDILANRFGEHWILKEKELDGLSRASDAMLIRYAKWLEKNGIVINFGLWLFIIVVPRLRSPEKRGEPEKKKSGKEN